VIFIIPFCRQPSRGKRRKQRQNGNRKSEINVYPPCCVAESAIDAKRHPRLPSRSAAQIPACRWRGAKLSGVQFLFEPRTTSIEHRVSSIAHIRICNSKLNTKHSKLLTFPHLFLFFLLFHTFLYVSSLLCITHPLACSNRL